MLWDVVESLNGKASSIKALENAGRRGQKMLRSGLRQVVHLNN